LCLKEKIFI